MWASADASERERMLPPGATLGSKWLFTPELLLRMYHHVMSVALRHARVWRMVV